jgi:hypothetical protein
MHVSVNECSFQGQASNRQEASRLMRGLGQLLKATEPIRGTDSICTHSTIYNRKLCCDYTIYDWIHEDSIDRDERNVFVILVKSGPFIDRLIADAGINCTCKIADADISFSSIAGAHHFAGLLASLEGAADFATGMISLASCVDGLMASIFNLTKSEDIALVRRTYRPSQKHQTGGFGTIMDLTDSTAQQVLDHGVPHGRQIYGFYNGRYYEFQPERLLIFHGYPISESAVPALAKRELIRQQLP